MYVYIVDTGGIENQQASGWGLPLLTHLLLLRTLVKVMSMKRRSDKTETYSSSFEMAEIVADHLFITYSIFS